MIDLDAFGTVRAAGEQKETEVEYVCIDPDGTAECATVDADLDLAWIDPDGPAECARW
jgi:hypothetical protein